MSIKVLHVNYYENKGGAAIAVKRIHDSQKLVGIESKIITAEKESSSKDVFGPSSTLEEIKWKILISLNRKISKFEKKKKYDSNSYNFLPSNFLSKIKQIDCDIINLHWIGNNLLPIKSLNSIKKPIVWTLHDMWPYTGSEHYTKNLRFVDGYTYKNKPEDLKGFDFEKYSWDLKKKYYPKDLKIVVTSDWQINNVKKSYLLKNNDLHKIPYPLDFNFWKMIDKKVARNILNLPLDKKIILIGAERIDLERKGYHFIKEILKKINTTDMIVLVFGRNEKKIKEVDNLKIIYLDEVKSNSYDIKILYSAADVFLATSTQESFGQTALEAASCCLPTVCFQNNGISEIVTHKVNGYAAKEFDLNDFNYGIDWCLNNLNENIMQDSLLSIQKKFSPNIIGESYKKLYESIV